MLRIRFSRTGKVGQPSFRIVVAEHRAPVKGRYIEMLGHYMPARKQKALTVDKEKVLSWIKKGAIPTESVASLLKKEGMTEMESYIVQHKRKRTKKGEQAEKPPVAEKPAEKSAA